MFFQELEHDKQVDCMGALFDRLNESLFGNCLGEGPFDEICIGVGGYEENIANLFTHGDTEYHNERDFSACYIPLEGFRNNLPGFEKVQGIIVIRQATVDELITKGPTEELQIKMLASILLHEMTHLFCDKHGIYGHVNHDKAWEKVARDHGLIPTPPGELDLLAPKAAQAIKDLYFFSDLLTEEAAE